MEDHDLSLECVSSVEAFPKKPFVKDDPDLEVPFPQLCGESVEFLGHASDAIIVLSNYRLLIRYPHSFVNVPVRLIESVECKELFYLLIQCKDGKSLRCKFSTNELCQDWLLRLTASVAAPEKLEDVFAFAFHAWCFDQLHREPELPMPGTCFLQAPGGLFEYDFDVERRRLGFDMELAWRVFENKDFKFCSTYPKMHIVPAWAIDDDIRKVANFRTSHRFPSVVWRHQLNGAVIARCSQPAVGWLGWRSPEDECMMAAILTSCIADDPRKKPWEVESENKLANGLAGGESRDNSTNAHMSFGVPSQNHQPKTDLSLLPQLGSNETAGRKLLIIDARSYTAAWANRAKGGGCECPEYYASCDIQFMGLANIHVIRKSFHSVRTLCSSSPDISNWLTSLETTKWLQHLSLLLKSTAVVVNAIEEGHPVVVHCTDGWDRTPQIIALAELMLDPYYRTLEGFQILVEREWLDFGHKFGDRCGHQPGHDDNNERCPVFVQWLDAVHQLFRQYPTAFEFNETFLIKLVQHTYSCLFGTFLCNSALERQKYILKERTCSVWSLLVVEGHKYRNFLYNPNNEQVLNPAVNIRDLALWTSVYMSDSAPASPDESAPQQTPVPSPTESSKLNRTRSVDDIHTASTEEDGRRGSICDNTSMPRRLSDPNLSDLRLEGRIGTPPPNRKLSERPPDMPNMESRDRNEPRLGRSDESGQVSELELAEREPLMNGHSDLKSDSDVETDDDDDNTLKETIAPLSNGHDDLLNGHDDHMNGNCVEDEFIFDSSNSNKNSITSTPVKACRTNSDHSVDSAKLEGSTDTLTDEMSSQPGDCATTATHNGHLCNGDAQETVTPKGSRTNSINEICGDIIPPNMLSPNGRKLGHCTSISTSTSDISSSHVGMSEALCLESMRAPLFWSTNNLLTPTDGRTRPMPSNIKLSSDPRSRNLSGGSSIPAFASTHSNPRPSPGLENNLKFSAMPNHNPPPQPTLPMSPSSLRLGRHLDEDGLTCVNMPQQTQLLDVMEQHEQEIVALHQKVQQLHSYLKQMQEQQAMGLALPVMNGEVNGEMLNQKDLESELGEAGKHSRCNSLHSDLSWEQVNEEDARRTLWVPDHAVTQCPMCNIQFGLLYRRHHCRSCGHIFCGRCSNYFTSIPKEQLYKPERVCKTCYDQLLSAINKETQPHEERRKPEMVVGQG